MHRDGADSGSQGVQVSELLLMALGLVLSQPHILGLCLGVPILQTVVFAQDSHLLAVLFALIFKLEVDLASSSDPKRELRLLNEFSGLELELFEHIFGL